MPRYQILIEYVGTNFRGWQIQKKGKTVQGLLQQQISKLLKEKIVLYGAGRLDLGVHAEEQSAHFDCKNDINEYDFILGPLTNNLFDYTVKLVNNYDVKIVRPLAKKTNINKNIINTIPDDSIYFNTIIDFIKNDL